ncbi:GspE/PulE family protein [Patescibacteria group bacterium]|nr:GspE/PulE family protein [Patescibacteria group bacterium]
MDPKVLLENLVTKNIIDKEGSDKILRESFLTQKGIEEIIYNKRLIDETVLAEAKSQLLKVPFKKVKVDEVDKEVLQYISEDVARTYKMVPLSKTDEMLVVGMVNPDNEKAQNALKFVAKRLQINLGIFLITFGDYDIILRKYSPFKDEVAMAIKSLNLKNIKSESSEKLIQLEQKVSVTEEAPIIKIVASTLKEAVNQGASDIHFEPGRFSMRVRFRIDGDLRETTQMPPELHQPIISRIKVMANLKIDETRIPQDGRFRTVVFGRDIDFRISTFPTPAGEKVAIRILDSTVGLKGLDELGLMGKNSDMVKEAISKPYGMILITGPTGSGKTTTLYALLQILNEDKVNIVSLEDPVEYYIEGINQSQVKPEIGYTFAAGLRQILRQDPDIIMVGEIRDSETASLAVHAALTGHIVLSTLHTNNAIGVIPRLIDMDVDSFLIPSSLNLVISQRLVSKLCEKCKKAEEVPASVAEIIKKELDKLPDSIKSSIKAKEPFTIYKPVGCSACKNKGISGRVGLFEILQMTKELEKIINTEMSEAKILEEAKRQGMISLRQDGILKALEGSVGIDEILRETSE